MSNTFSDFIAVVAVAVIIKMINLHVEGAGVDGGGMGGVLHRQERLDGAHLGINFGGLDHDFAFG